MSGKSQIPNKVINAAVYRTGNAMRMGVGDVTLPSWEALTDTLNGAGIMGEIDAPSPGQFGSATLGVAWRTVDRDQIYFFDQGVHSLEIRGAQDNYDLPTGGRRYGALKVVYRGLTKTNDLGTLAPNTATGGSTEFETLYYKMFIDNEEVLEIDKLNFIFKVFGVDQLADIRRALGMI